MFWPHYPCPSDRNECDLTEQVAHHGPRLTPEPSGNNSLSRHPKETPLPGHEVYDLKSDPATRRGSLDCATVSLAAGAAKVPCGGCLAGK